MVKIILITVVLLLSNAYAVDNFFVGKTLYDAYYEEDDSSWYIEKVAFHPSSNEVVITEIER